LLGTVAMYCQVQNLINDIGTYSYFVDS